MSQLEDAVPGNLVPYERGIGLGSVVRATLTRFLPASAVTVGTASWLLGLPAGMEFLAGVFGVAVPLSIGFGVGLEGLRRWLYPDAEVDGRRSVIAGLMSPVVLFIMMATGHGFSAPAAMLLFTVIGIVMAVLMFFAWLTLTPEEMRERDLRVPGNPLRIGS